jgi:hypothetical protein
VIASRSTNASASASTLASRERARLVATGCDQWPIEGRLMSPQLKRSTSPAPMSQSDQAM